MFSKAMHSADNRGSSDKWERRFLSNSVSHGYRTLRWRRHPKDVEMLMAFLSREGPLIKRDLTLKIDEAYYPQWPEYDLCDFMSTYGQYFSTLSINTLDNDDGNRIDQPMSRERIEEIEKASAVSSLIISCTHLEPFVSLITQPHIRHLKLEDMEISTKTVELLRNHSWETLELHNCIFLPNASRMLRDSPIPSLRVTLEASGISVEQMFQLPSLPCLKELHIIDFIDGDDVGDDIGAFLYIIPQLTDLCSLSIPYGATDREVELIHALVPPTNLTHLDIRSDCFGDATINTIAHLSNLRHLDLQGTNMTASRCNIIVKCCPLLEDLILAYDGHRDNRSSMLNDNTTELLELILILSTLKHLRRLTIILSGEMKMDVSVAFISRQLQQMPLTIKNIPLNKWVDPLGIPRRMDILEERNEYLRKCGNQYMYIVFLIAYSWASPRMSGRWPELIMTLPKEIVILTLAKCASWLYRSELATKNMVEFVWSNRQLMKDLIHQHCRFKIVQSMPGENTRLVIRDNDNQWKTVA